MRRWIVPLACLAVTVAALAAALLTKRSTPRPSAKQLAAAYVASPKAAGVNWASLDNPGPVAVAGNGRYWIAFRAFALGRSETIELLGGGGAHWSATIGAGPAIHFFGPLVLQIGASYWLTPTESSRTAGERIFYSDFRLVTRPLAALPGPGFWPQDIDSATGRPVNWLNVRGAIDVASEKPIPRAWLSFDVTSVDRERTLTVSQGTRSFRVTVPERGASKHVTVGPFDLHGGAGRVQFVSPGAAVTGQDARTRTVRLAELEALPTAPGQ